MPDTTDTRPAHDVLTRAGAEAGVPTTGAELIRDGSNVLYCLPGGIVARIGPPGTVGTAEHLLRVSRWLAATGIPTVHALDTTHRPTLVDDRPVTWWAELPHHRHATPAELGATLRRIHALTPPDNPPLPVLDPFHGLAEAISNATTLTRHDHDLLTDLLARLRQEYATLHPDPPRHVVHGDAWQGNLAITDDGTPVLLDLDHLGLGTPDWDLTPIAVDHTDFARITPTDYTAFVTAYGGHDVTTAPAYRTLATTTELRWTTYLLRKAHTNPHAATEAEHRLRCLRGDIPHPWHWTAF
ncbi:phosphotransferase [Actinosynnema sp. NPDC020468]|uniref:phosphotransferase n=1 Tax=Actinosynnema sp. NPDC020468 TaxID=3154488 RepID=UPI0033F400F0